MSLKQKILDTLKIHNRLDLNQLAELCKAYPAKQSVAEKRLREMREPLHKDYHPEVQLEFKNGYINAYVWRTNEVAERVEAFMEKDKTLWHPPINQLTLKV